MTAADFGSLIGGLAAIAQVAGYGLYLRGMLQHQIAPNSTSWLLWAVGSSVSLAIYSRVTSDLALLALPIACAISSIAIVVVTARLGRLLRPDRVDLCFVALDIAVVGVWFVAGTTWAYVALLLDIVITHLPILRSTRKNPEGEIAMPWFIWTLAYLLMLVAAILRQQDRDTFMFPLVLATVSGAVWLLAYRGKPKSRQNAQSSI